MEHEIHTLPCDHSGDNYAAADSDTGTWLVLCSSHTHTHLHTHTHTRTHTHTDTERHSKMCGNGCHSNCFHHFSRHKQNHFSLAISPLLSMLPDSDTGVVSFCSVYILLNSSCRDYLALLGQREDQELRYVLPLFMTHTTLFFFGISWHMFLSPGGTWS